MNQFDFQKGDARESTDRQFGPNFKWGNTGIQGPPVWSEFKNGECRDPRTAGLVKILKKGCRDPRTADLIRIFKKSSAGIHGPPAWSEFKKGMQGSTDRQFGQNFQKGMQGSTSAGPKGPKLVHKAGPKGDGCS